MPARTDAPSRCRSRSRTTKSSPCLAPCEIGGSSTSAFAILAVYEGVFLICSFSIYAIETILSRRLRSNEVRCWFIIFWVYLKIEPNLNRKQCTSIHGKGVSQHHHHNRHNEHSPRDADCSDDSPDVGLWFIVTVAYGGHGDDGHPDHVGVDGGGWVWLDCCVGDGVLGDVVELALGDAEGEGKGEDWDYEDSCDEQKGRVFEDALHAEHEAVVGSV